MKIGLVGLPGSGKTTCFRLLTGQQATDTHGRQSDVAVVPVPDPRTERLFELCQPKKMTQPEITVLDLLALRGGDSAAGEELHLVKVAGEADAFALVIQCFGELDHQGEPLDPRSDLDTLLLEMALTDLTIIEGRLTRLEDDREPKEAHDRWEHELLSRCRDHLSSGSLLAQMDFASNERKHLRGFTLLTMKPLLVVLNVAEDDLQGQIAQPARQLSTQRQLPPLTICAKLEEEISQLSPDEAKAFLTDYGLEEPGRDRFIRAAYQLLDVITFFTVNENEVRAWTISAGATAWEAAGKVHTDLQRGFIRAEVTAFAALAQHGSFAACREQGLMRLEGRDYPVQDGDILQIRFSK